MGRAKNPISSLGRPGKKGRSARLPHLDRTSVFWLALTFLVLAVWLRFIYRTRFGSGEPVPARAVRAVDRRVRIPVAELSDGQARFYQFTPPGKETKRGATVRFFVVAASDGGFRVALDASHASYNTEGGYRQRGTDMVCQGCGGVFPIEGLGRFGGGCNPIPLKHAVEDGNVVIEEALLEESTKYFPRFGERRREGS